MSSAPAVAKPRGRAARGRLARVFMRVLWPAFLLAVIAEGVFFSMIDPHELRVVARYLNESREAAYTVAFFVFWALFACSSGITYLLGQATGQAPGVDEEAD